jgi:gliding motility-associated-like protein
MNLKCFLAFVCVINSISICFVYAQQADNYAFTTNKSSSLINLTSPIRLHGAGALEASSAVTPIGFEFWFMGTRHTSFSINTNGVVQLGSRAIITGGNAYNIPNASRIVAFAAGDVLNNTSILGTWRVSANDGVIHYQVFGTSPSRTLVIECKNMNVNFQSTTNDATFQIILYETAPLASANNRGGRIEFRYGQAQISYNTGGLRTGFGIGEGSNQFKGVDLSSDPPTAPITEDIIENKFDRGTIDVLNGVADGGRRVIIFEPPYPSAQATNLRAACAGKVGEVQLDWDNTASNALGSVVYRSTDGTNFSFLRQTVKDANAFNDSGLAVGQTYYYRVYSVTEGKLCELHPTAQLTVNYPISAKNLKIDGKPLICNGIASLEAEGGFSLYEWFNSQGTLIKSSKSPLINITAAGKYTVSALDSVNQCLSTGEISVSECCEPILEIPNAFTPHNTPANNIFRVKHENLKQFKMQIFDRWGVLVFKSEDPEEGWNGNLFGRPCELGVYQVVIEYTGCQDGRTVRGKKQEVLNLLE